MLSFLLYLIKVCAWLAPFYLLYLTVYKRFTFFSWNRYYLLLIVIASFLLPFVQYNYITQEIVWHNTILNNMQVTLLPDITQPSLSQLLNSTIPTSVFNWGMLISILYIIGAAIKVVQLSFGLLGIKRLINNSRQKWTNNLALVLTNDKVPHSSFFHYIFLNTKTQQTADTEKIIYHEMQHNEKLHTIDVLFCEILKIILWFFPLVYWFKKSLQEIHEFEVDSEMTKLYNEVTYAELLVQVATVPNKHTAILHPFSTKPLKARLKMIFNKKTYPLKKLAFLLTIPVIALLLMAYGNVKIQKTTINKSKAVATTLVIDAGHGGSDGGAIYNAIKESELTLTLAKRLQQKAIAAGYTVIMTRTTDEFVALKERSALTTNNKVDLFLSLHINMQDEGTDKNGLECYSSTSANKEYSEPSAAIATKILANLATLNGITVNTNLQKRDRRIWVLQATTAPSLLLEVGYLSNTNDRIFITNTTYQDALATKIMDGINQYYNVTK